MKLTKIERKQLIIFGVVTYGLTFLLGIIMYIGKKTSVDASAMIVTQMMYPSVGAISALWLTQKKDNMIPKYFYIMFLSFSSLMMVMSVLSIFFPGGRWGDATSTVILIGTIFCVLAVLLEDTDKRKAYGLSMNHARTAALYLVLFIVLFLIGNIIIAAVAGDIGMIGSSFRSEKIWIALIMLLPAMFGSILTCLGEEYGWRYFLQPRLQKRFGKRIGVLMLGVVWGIWHLPVDIARTSDYHMSIFVARMIVCVSVGIFLAYVFMKTDNIWLSAAIHVINNFLHTAELGDTGGAQVSEWTAVLYMLISYSVFALFIFSKEFRKTEKGK